MKKQILIMAIGLLVQLGFAQKNINQEILATYDMLMSEQYNNDGTGASVLIAKQGQVIYSKGFGMADLELNAPMTSDHVFRIGSITKQFTAVAILQLVEQGKLNLRDDITLFIPDYPTEGHKINIEHLLTHTSGIRNFTSMKNDDPQRGKIDFTPLEMVNYFKNEPLQFIPGTKWEYSNSGYVLLGYIIEKVTGKSYGEYLHENLFLPLGLANTFYANDIKIIKNRASGYSIGEQGIENAPFISMTHPYAAGSILSTVEDLYKWHQAIHAGKVISKTLVEKAWSRYCLTDGKPTNYGYGWRLGNIQESPSVWHGGLINGFMTMAMYLPKEEVFVAILSNNDQSRTEDIIAKMAALTIGKPYTYTQIPLDNTLLQDYTGLYENDKGQLRIMSIEGNQLYSQLGRGPKFEAKPYQKDKFFFDDNPFLSLHYTRDAKGAIINVTSRNRDGDVIWIKSDKPIPSGDGIKVDVRILETYVGEYEIAPEFSMTITREENKLFLQATGQEKLEMFAENENVFFLKVNDATLEFIKDDAGQVAKALLNQGGRQAQARKVK